MERRKFLQHTLLTTAGLALVPVLTKGQALLSKSGHAFNVSARAYGSAFQHNWSKCVGAGFASEGLRATWLENLTFVKEHCGFEYVRLNGLCNHDMLVSTEQNGQPAYHWHYIDDLLDRLLDIGVKPFVELQPISKNNISENLHNWSERISALAAHCIARYGADEVRNWRFETQSISSFETYKVVMAALKSNDSQLKAGVRVPAEPIQNTDVTLNRLLTPEAQNANETYAWLHRFLGYCKTENLPVDFVSTINEPDENDSNPSKTTSAKIRKALTANAFSAAEIHLIQDGTSLRGTNQFHSAASVIKVNLEELGHSNSLAHRMFTEPTNNSEASLANIHEGYSLVSYHGITSPAFHGYRMLHQLGNEMLYREGEDGFIITRHSLNQKIAAILYHNPSEINTARNINFHMTDLPFNAAFEIEILDKEIGNFTDLEKQTGSPATSTRKEIQKLKDLSMTTRKERIMADLNGILTFRRDMNPGSVILIKQI